MPRIPIYEDQVKIERLPGVTQQGGASAEEFGAGIGRALAGVGGDMQKIAIDFQQRDDTLRAKQAYREASKELSEFLRNPETGLYARKIGENARGAAKELQDAVQKIAGQHTKGLSAKQREMFDNVWFNSTQSESEAVSRHELSQFQQVENATDKALLDQATEDMVSLYNSPADVAKANNRGNMALTSMAVRNGWSQDMLNHERSMFLSKSYSEIVMRYLQNDDPEGAKNAYQKYEKDIDGRIKGDLEAKISRDTEIIKAQEAETVIYRLFPKALYGVNRQTAAEEYVRKNYSGNLEDVILNRLHARFSADIRAENQKTEADVKQNIRQLMTMPDDESWDYVQKIDNPEVKMKVEQARHSLIQMREFEEQRVFSDQGKQLLGVIDTNLLRGDYKKALGLAKAAADPQIRSTLLNYVQSRTPAVQSSKAQELFYDTKDPQRAYLVHDFMQAVDEGKYPNYDMLRTDLAATKLPYTDINTVLDYFRKGGSGSNMYDFLVKEYKNIFDRPLSERLLVDPNYVDRLLARRPAGIEPTSLLARNIISQAETAGTVEDNFLYFDKTMSFDEAQQKGVLTKFTPINVPTSEAFRILRELSDESPEQIRNLKLKTVADVQKYITDTYKGQILKTAPTTLSTQIERTLESFKRR